MCLRVCGSGFWANTIAIIGPDAQLLSFFHTLSLSLSLSYFLSGIIFHDLQKMPIISYVNTLP